MCFSLPLMNRSAGATPSPVAEDDLHSSANSVVSCTDSNYDSGAFSRTSSPELGTPPTSVVESPSPPLLTPTVAPISSTDDDNSSSLLPIVSGLDALTAALAETNFPSNTAGNFPTNNVEAAGNFNSSAATTSLPTLLPPLVSPPLVLSLVRQNGGSGGGGDLPANNSQLLLACLSAAGRTSSFDLERLSLGEL